MGLLDFISSFFDNGRETPQRKEFVFNIPTKTITIDGVASFTMKKIKGGTFWMGATPEQGNDASDIEKPCHQVTVGSFFVSELVDVEFYSSIIGGYNSHSNSFKVSNWYDCQLFLNKLNDLTGKRFRLPTEAEWEFLARGGNKSKGYKYINGNQPNTYYYSNLTIQNELQLGFEGDGYGEWCQDIYSPYTCGRQTNPTGPTTGMYRVLRYGNKRVSQRGFGIPSQREARFRIVLPCISFSR